MYVIVREDGMFLAGTRYIIRTGESYTRNILSAKKFKTLDEAKADYCPQNERIHDALALLWDEGR